MSEEGAVQVKIEEHDGLFKQNREEHKDMWKAINMIRNRPPFMAVVVITSLFGLCTALITALAIS